MTGWRTMIYVNFGWDATHVNCRSNLWCNPSLQLRCSRRFSSSFADSVWSARRGHTMRRPMADWEGGNCRELTCKYLLDLWTSNCRKQWVTRSKSSSFFCLIVVRSVLFIYIICVLFIPLCSHESIHRSVAMNLSPVLPHWNSHRSKKCIVVPMPASTLQKWFASHPFPPYIGPLLSNSSSLFTALRLPRSPLFVHSQRSCFSPSDKQGPEPAVGESLSTPSLPSQVSNGTRVMLSSDLRGKDGKASCGRRYWNP